MGAANNWKIFKEDLYEWINQDSYTILIFDIISIFGIIQKKSLSDYKEILLCCLIQIPKKSHK